MKYLIIGLGNPGEKYENTRHNIGFLVLDALAEAHSASFKTEKLADKSDFKYKGRSISLIKPNTYMNLSGKAVNYWMQQLKISRENIMVIVDDIALDFGKLRMRAKGSAGGHNGLSNIEQVIQGSNYPRLRFGIGNNFHKGQQADYVLSDFSAEEMAAIETPIKKACNMLLAFTTVGLPRTMSQYND